MSMKIVYDNEGYWLMIMGKKSAVIRLTSESKMVLESIEEEYKNQNKLYRNKE